MSTHTKSRTKQLAAIFNRMNLFPFCLLQSISDIFIFLQRFQFVWRDYLMLVVFFFLIFLVVLFHFICAVIHFLILLLLCTFLSVCILAMRMLASHHNILNDMATEYVHKFNLAQSDIDFLCSSLCIRFCSFVALPQSVRSLCMDLCAENALSSLL